MKKNALFLSLLVVLVLLVSCNQVEQREVVFSSAMEAGPGEKLLKGCVYFDENKNGEMDEGELGIGGVAVSNGVDIVQTDDDGNYALAVADDAVVFIVKPKGWTTPLNEENLPQYYYLHKPNGYPENYTYKGVEPSGELPASVNFPLYKSEEASAFKILVFGDTQPYSIEQIDFIAEDIVNELVGVEDVAFGLTMGDIVGDNLSFFDPLNQVIAKVGVPWYYVLGNHDVNYMAPNDELSDETYERVYGPSTYAFEYGDVHFLILDDIIHDSEAGSRKYTGGLRPDQFTFIENYLKLVPKEKLVVLNMHIPILKEDRAFRKEDKVRLFELLKEHPNTLSISAHTHNHKNYFFDQETTDWLQSEPHHHFNVGTTSGSWWGGLKNEVDVPHTMMSDGTPNGYAFISFEGSDYVIDWKVAGSPDTHQMNIHVPRGIQAGEQDTVLLSVNFFNGSAESEVSYRIPGDTDWVLMKKVEKPDPYYLKINERWEDFKAIKLNEIWETNAENVGAFPAVGGMPRPASCSHLWEANIGSDFPVGRHVIEVKAKDRYGRTFSAYHTLRVKQ